MTEGESLLLRGQPCDAAEGPQHPVPVRWRCSWGWGAGCVGSCHERCSEPCLAQTRSGAPLTPAVFAALLQQGTTPHKPDTRFLVTWIHPVLSSRTHFTDKEEEEPERSGGASSSFRAPPGRQQMSDGGDAVLGPHRPGQESWLWPNCGRSRGP